MNLKKLTALTVAAGMFWNSAYAGLAPVASESKKLDISAEAILSTQGDLRGELTQSLQDERVLKELAKMGVTKNEVVARMAAMSDQELQQVKQGLNRQAGGDAVVISVTTLLLIIIIILLIR